MVKRKKADGDSMEGDQTVPIPIQTFLWRQTSPFIRPKYGKISESSCVSFERVIVQNILHGLSPSLCEAIQSITRWKLVQAALPHVIHCCSSMLANRNETNPEARFMTNEIKLLYTLHWIILDAASECEDLESEQAMGRSVHSYLHSLDTIQLFVFLLIPLVSTLKESDFQSLKLENGLRLWEPLWNYRQPDVPCFSTPVKARRVVLKAQRNLLKVNFNMANIYIGKGTSNDNIYMGFDDPDPKEENSGENENEQVDPGSPRAPIARMSDICALSTTGTSTSVDVACEVCNQTLQTSSSGIVSCKCGERSVNLDSETSDARSLLAGTVGMDKNFMAQRLESAISTFARSYPNPDVLSASYFDVAVLQCLFCPQWEEDGIYWALHYMHQRLLEISAELQNVDYHRERSQSLPTPEIRVMSCDSNDITAPTSPRKDSASVEAHFLANMSLPLQNNASTEVRNEPTFKKMRITEVKDFIGDRMRMLRPIETGDQIDTSGYDSAIDNHSSIGPVRPDSALSRLTENDEDSPEDEKESGDSLSDSTQQKNSLKHFRANQLVTEEDDDSSGSGGGRRLGPSKPRASRSELLPRPIITITRDSPEVSPGPTSPRWPIKRADSIMSVRSKPQENCTPFQRSMTDSTINYSNSDEVEEVPGSIFYIQQNGQLNYDVILQAIHNISRQHCSPRVCGITLNIINCFLDLGVIGDGEKKLDMACGAQQPPSTDPPKDENFENLLKTKKERLEKDAAFCIAMETTFRVYRVLGCPHGCGEGVRGLHGDQLRTQAVNCLMRLMKANTTKFRKFLQTNFLGQPLQSIIDSLHSLLGFCCDVVAAPPTAGVKKTSVSDPGGHRTGYSNDFGELPGGGNTIQGQLIVLIFKSLMTKFVENKKELMAHENISLYCDVRQLINYIKETHGGSFRRVALSGLIDALRPVKTREPVQPVKVMRRTLSMTSDSGDERDNRSVISSEASSKPRASIFIRNKKNKKHILPFHGTTSDDNDDSGSFHGRLSPRVSVSVTEDDLSLMSKRKSSKFVKAWRRSTKSDHEDDSSSEMTMCSRENQSQEQLLKASTGAVSGVVPQTKQRMSFKATSQATLRLLSARRRIEDGLKSFSKRHQSKRESVCDENIHRSGHDLASSSVGKESVIVREKKLINSFLLKSGLLRFNFMLDCCNPGTLPDPHLMAALLDLDAPVIARAALLLECAHFVNRCNRGEWPNWMKLNLPGFCSSGMTRVHGQQSGYRRNLLLQKLSGRLFHQWAEALGNRMSDLLIDESPDFYSFIDQVKDDGKKRELRSCDDEEDFLDEATVNPTGTECPYALKMVVCQLLLEITTFLRETYQYIPKSKSSQSFNRHSIWEKPGTSRRWSSVLGSPGNSERSNSRSSQGDGGSHSAAVSDRKISFAVLGASERSDSVHSSTTSISQVDVAGEGKGKRAGGSGQKLLKLSGQRRNSGHNASFKHNRSFKIKPEGGGIMRIGSTKSRKVSTQSLQSANSAEETPSSYAIFEEAEESTTPTTSAPSTANVIEEIPELSDLNDIANDDRDYSSNMPWVKIVVQLANKSNFVCDHQNYCHANCYERQRRSCTRLIMSLQKMYACEKMQTAEPGEVKVATDHKDSMKDKMKRRESMFHTSSSPTSRRDSATLLERVKVHDVTLINKAKSVIAAEREEEKKNKNKKPAEELSIVKYLNSQVLNLNRSPLALIAKAASILPSEIFIDMMPVSWELLLESDQELAAAAAVVFILASVRANEAMRELMIRQLQHQDVTHRINATLRFGVLWGFRFQVWPRMEDGVNASNFKLPPPNIDFVLPSPTIGLPSLPIIDPPWMPHFKTKVEEVTINQKESKSFVTATTTRRKQQQQMIHQALLAEEDRRRAARENCHMTSVPIAQLAGYEPALLHTGEDHEDALQEEISLAVASRRMSVAPVNRASNVRNMSGRHGSMFFGRPTLLEDDDKSEHLHSHHMQLAQSYFPSFICQAALPIIELLDDLDVNGDGIAVCEVAEKVIWKCLVEEPTLFLRTFLEELTNSDKRRELICLLRKLLYHLKNLPAQTSHCVFNYLIGFIMFYVRSPTEGGQEAVIEALSVIWQVVPCVSGIYFKDLKQTLRKEQCDPTLLIAANVPSAKKLIVHGPDLIGIPSQYPIQEDTQFLHILHESLDFFNIPPEEQSTYFLVDTKTNQMHNLNSYVRDFYFFRRNFHPQLSLVCMNQQQATLALEKQTFNLKFLEMGKVLFSMSVLGSSQGQQLQNHVSYLHEELLKLPSFPRKALESEFGIHHKEMGKEIAGLDLLHKFVWTKLIADMFRGMSSTITHVGDLPLFLNVVNGTLFLHADDTATLRLCLATFINACQHFKQVFATTGFTFIMPTILKVYSYNQSNAVVLEAIQFACRQFFLLHRNYFVLQMFGSISSLLDSDSQNDFRKIRPKEFFQLLLSLEKNVSDNLEILDMVEGEKPLRPLDFCYKDDPDVFTIMDAMNLCVTVIAYACDSVRAVQMLTILEAILPHYLRQLSQDTLEHDSLTLARDEISAINNLSVLIKALVASCENLSRNFSGAQWQFESNANATAANNKSVQNHSNHSPKNNKRNRDELSDIRFLNMEEGKWHQPEDDTEMTLRDFRKPRDSILSIASKFFSHCSSRVRELKRLFVECSIRFPELLDHKTHWRLAEIALSLLKVSPYDPGTMKCSGLKGYMLEVLPITDWSQTGVRLALQNILRRLDRLFGKLYKRSVLRRQMDWNAATNLVKSINVTLVNCPYVGHIPYMKNFIAVCLNIVLADDTSTSSISGSSHSIGHKSDGFFLKSIAPQKFCSATIKLTAQQLYALGDSYTLEFICGGSSVFPTQERMASVLVNLVLPLCIRMGSGRTRRDYPRMRQVDITFALSIMLHALLPPVKQQASTGSSKLHHLSVTDVGRTGSVMSQHSRRSIPPKDGLQNIAFLGLKILIVCFEKQLALEWYRISRCISQLATNQMGGSALWRFLDFVVTTRTPLFVMLYPFIQYKMMKAMCETEQEYFVKQLVHEKLRGHSMPDPKCKGSVLVDLATELKQVRDELALSPELRLGGVSSPVHSDVSHRNSSAIPRTSSLHDLLEHQVATRLQSAPTMPSAKKYQAKELMASLGTVPGVLQNQVPPTTETSTDSPALSRKASKRIMAQDGSLILGKYLHKSSSQGEDVNNDVRSDLTSRKLRRQTSQPASLQPIFSGFLPPSYSTLYESTPHQDSFDQEGGRPNLTTSNTKERLHRNSPVILRGVLRKACIIGQAPASVSRKACNLPIKAAVRFSGSTPTSIKTDSNCSNDHNSVEEIATGHPQRKAMEDQEPGNLSSGALQEFDPRAHRLQRQDAKSRKTFKIKRHCSTFKGSNMTRSATVKGGSSRYGSGAPSTDSPEPAPDEPFETAEPQIDESLDGVANLGLSKNIDSTAGMSEVDLELGIITNGQCVEGTIIKNWKLDGPRTVDSDTESLGSSSAVDRISKSTSSSRPARFMQKSKSHDDANDSYAPAGTARGRIARHGARLLQQTRSPSSSPTHQVASCSERPTEGEFLLTKSESSESLNAREDSSLLTKDEKNSRSNASLMLFFDPGDMKDTCV